MEKRDRKGGEEIRSKEFDFSFNRREQMKKTDPVVRGRRRRHSAQILREEIVLRQMWCPTVPDGVENQAGEIFMP